MSFKKNKYLDRYKTHDTAFKRDTRMSSPSDLTRLQSVCINDAASTSTSNESILLSDTERSHNEPLDVRYPDIKNNKCKSTPIILHTRDESCAPESTSLRPHQSNFTEVNRSDSIKQQIIVGRENVVGRSKANLNSRNKVPESCKLITPQNAACKVELIPECLSRTANLDYESKTFCRKKLSASVNNKPRISSMETEDTDVPTTSRDDSTSILYSCTIEDDICLINNEDVPDKNKKDFQREKINNHMVEIFPNNLSQRLTDDGTLSTKVRRQTVSNEQHSTLLCERTTAKDRETKNIENGVTALPIKPIRSLSSDLKASVKDNNMKSKLKNKLPGSSQSFSAEMQSTVLDNDQKVMEESTELRKSVLFHGDTNMLVFDSPSENNAIQNNAIDRDIHSASDINEEYNEQVQLLGDPNVKRKRGRPRKEQVIFNNENKERDDDTSREIPDTSNESMTRDKRQVNKITVTSNVCDFSDESDGPEDKIIVRKRGRPPGSVGRGQMRGRGRKRGRGKGMSQNSLDSEYIPRLTKDVSQLGTKKSDKINDTTVDSNASNVEKTIQLVTCAKCNQEVPKKQWSSHKLYQHNNMAWQKDEEPLDFENDEKLLKKVLAAALKQRKKYLICEKCETAKRSVNGFISHMQFCGKSEEQKKALMVTCPICKAVMMPSSVEVHERYHRQLEQNKDKEVTVSIERTKRKAAEIAVPKILELTKTLKEQNPSTSNVIRTPKNKKVPNVWKAMWKKELVSKGIVSCKQPGCTFTCSSFETICEHCYQCNFAPQENFMCKICKFSADSKNKIVNHITEVHSGNNDLDKCSDYEIEEDDYSSDESISECDSRKIRVKISSENTRISNKMQFLDKETLQSPQSTEAYKPTVRWTLDFELTNYELALFKDDMPNCFTLLKNDEAATYFPNLTISMAVKHVGVTSSKNGENSNNDNWIRINRFEGDVYKDVPTFFVGGPVWALAWLPIPSPMFSKNPTQYVAISTHPTMESQYSVGKKYSGPNIIQIWDVGPLDLNSNSENRSPVLAYAIAHNSGTVWCLEWCPSGCYQDIEFDNYKMNESKLRRMGLLAAACSDGCINIYSLPFADELKFEKTEDNLWPIYKTDPVMTLVVNILMYDANKQDWQCTRLSWTKEHGHSIIAAGFTNGYIGLWHLTTTSSLLLTQRQNTKFIDTFHHFFAHSNAITMVALVPYGNSRFLASASVDKSYKFWDLEDTTVPQSCAKKGIVANGVWMMHWPCAILSFDDALGYQYMHSYVMPLREHGYKFCPILATNSPTYGVAVSDHANSIAHGTLAGEVLTIFPHQLLYMEKIWPRKRQLNSFIETVDFLKEQQHNKDNKSKEKNCKEYHYMPKTYDECKDRFGIVFHDNLLDLKKSVARSKHRDIQNNGRAVPIEQYPFTSVNRMAWNPNAWSYLWLITGYQNGLVRLLNFKCMSRSRELNTLLPTHVQSVLAKKEQIN
ncbi:uncharacterized protein LOC105205720 isoform X2 [Solenopsis invicta]|uniref:uncharacterized protein LOC105205720 isoform X2 n=1 Tax=Solenopsis invicta TaxID=13686 RepID=UPI00193E8D5F|nr:uncharacterized protein LOC105205720 isoform X2 [Solenopsis invicta]XP_025987590.2 uncharacterized protein LOC105205720 isoform X2 [Solenopsis invicta]XP_025987591.2 uncharacterized protein LOC105205720 isoform X2 [Solenopsis invicta]XP_039306001.1 uncharacterized protein LOC105205720 isoform X2 [Solenopsis invicta]